MKKLIASKPIHKIKALFGNIEEYKARYAQLQKIFESNKEYNLFAEPVYVPEKLEIAWFVETEGKYVSFNKLTEEQQDLTKGFLKERMDRLIAIIEASSLSDKENIKKTIQEYFEIPEPEDIYAFFKGNEVEDVVLTEWGCISEAFNSKRGLITLMIPADWQPMKFKVIFEDGTIAPNTPIAFAYQDETTEKQSDENGFIDLGEHKLYSIIRAYPQGLDNKDIVKKYVCTGKPEYLIKIPKEPVMICKVVNEEHQAIPGVSIAFTIGETQDQKVSNNDGYIYVRGLKIGEYLEVFEQFEDGRNVLHKFLFDDESKEYLIVLNNKATDMLWKVVMKKNKPVPEAKVKFKHNKNITEAETNEEGYVRLQNVNSNQKVKAKAKKGKRRGKKKYVFKNPQQEHILKIRKPISLWWLLLLLLPFILLINWTKEVQFQVINKLNPSNTINANVKFTYTEREFFNFSDMRFMTYTNQMREVKTESNGIASFPGVKETLFSWIFYHNEPTLVIATSECFGSDTLRPSLPSLKNKKPYKVELGYLRSNFVFHVVNSQNNEPIPDAKVKLIAKSSGASQTYEAKSGVDGRALFVDVPVCSDFTIVTSAFGYHKKTMQTSGRDVYYKKKDKIPLEPLTKTVVFYIKNAKNRQPVPGATAHLIIDGKTIQKTYTNTNGAVSMVGQGTFQNVHVVKTMTIKGTKADYFDTTLTAKVAKFVQSNANQRTLFMRPKATSATFKVIDASNRKALSGAKIIMTVNGNRKTEYSNRNGSVTFANLFPGDKVTIYAEKNPGYLPNRFLNNEDISTIIDGPSSNTVIPLQPKAPPPPPPPPPNVKPCNGGSDATHANSSDVSNQYNLSKPNGKFQFDYYTDRAPDRIMIYSGNQKVWEFYGATKNKTKTAVIPFYDPIITVRVIGGTRWRYKVHCP